VALMVIGGMTMSQGFLHSIDNTSNNIQVISQRDEEIMRTNIDVLTANQTASNQLRIVIQNDGQTKLASYNQWDVIVNYFDAVGNGHVTWLPYTTESPGDNQWTLQGIYIDVGGQSPEVFNPSMLDPEEQMIIDCRLSPPVGHSTTNLVTISTPNGVTVSKTFAGY
jgi:hypothetical protein